jgi:hypothetical protein
MYHLHTSALELSEPTFQYIVSKDFSSSGNQNPGNPNRLRAIADLSFDLLSQVQKMEKLQKLQQLSKSEQAEYHSTVRLIGIMIHILDEYKYQDSEMIHALKRRYQKFSSNTRHNAAA